MATVQIPDRLRDELEHQARRLYGEDGTNQAVSQAIELWLTPVEEDGVEVARALNNGVYRECKPELEAKHWGQWAVIDQGRLQGVSPNFDAVKELGLGSGHRLVFRVGEAPPRKVRSLGWRIKRDRPCVHA